MVPGDADSAGRGRDTAQEAEQECPTTADAGQRNRSAIFDRIAFASRYEGKQTLWLQGSDRALSYVFALAWICAYALLAITFRLFGVSIGSVLTGLMLFVLAMALTAGLFAVVYIAYGRQLGLRAPAKASPVPNMRQWPQHVPVGTMPHDGVRAGPRITCVGSPGQLETYDELADVPFEPMIFNASLAWPFSWGFKALMFLCFTVITVALLCLAYRLLGPGAMPGNVLLPWVAAAVAAPLVAFFRPVYVRFVPGRLDVIHYRVLGGGVRRTEHYDLRTTPVVVDLRSWEIFIKDTERPVAFSCWLIIGWRRVVRALLLAALSTHEPGPVPDDRLTG